MAVEKVTLHLSCMALVMSISLDCPCCIFPILLKYTSINDIRTECFYDFLWSIDHCSKFGQCLAFEYQLDGHYHRNRQLYSQTDMVFSDGSRSFARNKSTSRRTTGARTGGQVVSWYYSLCDSIYLFSLGAADLSAAKEDYTHKDTDTKLLLSHTSSLEPPKVQSTHSTSALLLSLSFVPFAFGLVSQFASCFH